MARAVMARGNDSSLPPVRRLLVSVVLVLANLQMAAGHGYLSHPVSRNWRNRINGKEYCPHCLNGGTKTNVQDNTPGGLWSYPETVASSARAGLCGDPAGDNQPHMLGGSLDNGGTIEATYTQGQEFFVEVGISTHHRGHFELFLCDISDDSELTAACLQAQPLMRAEDDTARMGIDEDYPGRYYLEPACAGDHEYPFPGTDYTYLQPGQKVRAKYQLPLNVTCTHCVLQWWWITGNSCTSPGYDKEGLFPDEYSECSGDGPGLGWQSTGLRECGAAFPEEFWNCADIAITPSDGTTASTTVTTGAVTTNGVSTGNPTTGASTPNPSSSASSSAPNPSTGNPTAASTAAPNPDVLGYLTTSSAGSSETRREQFLQALGTYETVSYKGQTDTVLAIHSSGGAAGGVVTEGQGYGLLIGGVVAAAMDPTEDSWSDAVNDTYYTFKGWRQMNRLSTRGSCQSVWYCGDSCPATGGDAGDGCYPCLSHWKISDDMASVIGTGSASDGDIDAVTGMILLVLATQSRSSEFPWWQEVARATYQTCKQLLVDDTVAGTGLNAGKRILKLGSCWGGFNPQCNNPSYHAPGAFRAMRDYMIAFDDLFGTSDSEGDTLSAEWDSLTDTTYEMLSDNQCPESGLTTNWFKTGTPVGSGGGDTSCSGSGTPASQFGSEASRGVWRVVLDALWYPAASSSAAFGHADYLERIAPVVASRYTGAVCPACWNNVLDNPASHPGCLVTSIHSSWNWNAFMFGPIFSSLVPRVSTLSEGDQQTALDAAGATLAASSISDYYSGSWVAIATLTLNGDLAKAGTLLASLANSGTTATTTITTAAPTTAAPTNAQTTKAQTTTTTTTIASATTNTPAPTPSASSTTTTTSASSTASTTTTTPTPTTTTATTTTTITTTTSQTSPKRCHIKQCGCPGSAGAPSWCATSDTAVSGDWCQASEGNCEGSCSGVWCDGNTEPSTSPPSSTAPPDDEPSTSPPSSTAPPGDEGVCNIGACGCNPFDKSWCTIDGARVQSDWCQEGSSNCGACSGTWCHNGSRRRSVSEETVQTDSVPTVTGVWFCRRPGPDGSRTFTRRKCSLPCADQPFMESICCLAGAGAACNVATEGLPGSRCNHLKRPTCRLPQY